jgi:hypothetical protein
MRRALATTACVALLAGLTLAAPASAGRTQKVALGTYSVTLATPPGDYDLGSFAVVKSKRKRAMAPAPKSAAMAYPDGRQCGDLSGLLVAERIPVDRRGKFRLRERTQADRGNLVVTWRGRWREPRVATGRIVVEYGGCVSRLGWRAARVR